MNVVLFFSTFLKSSHQPNKILDKHEEREHNMHEPALEWGRGDINVLYK